jgi:endonuclease III
VTPDASKRWASLLKRLRQRYGPVADATGAYGLIAPAAASSPIPSHGPGAIEPVLNHLIVGMLIWNASSTLARAAHARLRAGAADFNDLRVCDPAEIASLIRGEVNRGDAQGPGPSEPGTPRAPDHAALSLDARAWEASADERASRIKAALMDVFRRHHAMTLGILIDASKREARAYLESLQGVPPSAAARVAVFALCAHATPIDDRTKALLVREGVVAAGASVVDASHTLERLVPATDSREVAALLQAWSDQEGAHATTPDHEAQPSAQHPPQPAAKPASKPASKPAKASTTKSSRAPKPSTSSNATNPSTRATGAKRAAPRTRAT